MELRTGVDIDKLLQLEDEGRVDPSPLNTSSTTPSLPGSLSPSAKAGCPSGRARCGPESTFSRREREERRRQADGRWGPEERCDASGKTKSASSFLLRGREKIHKLL